MQIRYSEVLDALAVSGAAYGDQTGYSIIAYRTADLDESVEQGNFEPLYVEVLTQQEH